jgi:hypothetical protein
LIALCAILAGCTITRSVEPVSHPIDSTLCIEENDDVWSKQFLPALRQSFERHGVRTSVYRGERPADCRYHATYVAKWRWDMATYLGYADIQIYDGDQVIGRALYDAGGGTASLRKFGSTMSKVDPLVDEMLPAPR